MPAGGGAAGGSVACGPGPDVQSASSCLPTPMPACWSEPFFTQHLTSVAAPGRSLPASLPPRLTAQPVPSIPRRRLPLAPAVMAAVSLPRGLWAAVA